MFFRTPEGELHVHCHNCHHAHPITALTTSPECRGCGQPQSISEHLSRAAETLIRQDVEIQMLKEDLHRATSKRTSPQHVAQLEKRIRTLEGQLQEARRDTVPD